MLRLRPAIVPCLALVLLTWAGCGTSNIGWTNRVMVESTPAGALVYENGKLLGTTPLVVELDRRRSHQLRLAKPYFRPVVAGVAPARNEAGTAFLQFGVMEDLGAYHELRPNPVQVPLVPELVPEQPGADRYAELSRRVLLADALLDEGEISDEEHRYIVDCLMRFFQE